MPDETAALIRVSMPKITAILHTKNDEMRLGRALESLRPCDELLVIDHGSGDTTGQIARDYGATVRRASGTTATSQLGHARYDWIFSVLPSESLSEELEASLLEWKQGEHDPDIAFSVAIREQGEDGWRLLPHATRLLNRRRTTWEGKLPPDHPQAQVLQGDLLRFRQP